MKFSTLIPFFAAILALAVACGTDSPTIDVDPQTAGEIKKAAVELFDDWLEATGKHDAAAVRGLLSSDITDRCTVEEFEQFFAMDDDALTYPNMGVKEVFVAVGNSDKAFMTMELLGEPRPGRRGEIDVFVAARPYPIVRENGQWHMVIEIFTVGEGCPFLGSFSRQEAVPADGSTPSP